MAAISIVLFNLDLSPIFRLLFRERMVSCGRRKKASSEKMWRAGDLPKHFS
ncbi:hypothetical protein [Paracidobacterium acidisoli]|uniref:hypothetical protein n=1 Tax=Paracidobacterium acidisoli TaxID=2303751 RepID=UPI001C01F8BD|nr:hypothetical protein [Paracidobacterium acidisoli]